MPKFLCDNFPETIDLDGDIIAMNMQIPLLRDSHENIKMQTDVKALYDLGFIHCNHREICILLGLSIETWERRLQDTPLIDCIIKKGQEDGKQSLRRMQVQKAMEGNITMLIWLGKQLLGQADKHDTRNINVNMDDKPFIAPDKLKHLKPAELEVLAKLFDKDYLPAPALAGSCLPSASQTSPSA